MQLYIEPWSRAQRSRKKRWPPPEIPVARNFARALRIRDVKSGVLVRGAHTALPRSPAHEQRLRKGRTENLRCAPRTSSHKRVRGIFIDRGHRLFGSTIWIAVGALL